VADPHQKPLPVQRFMAVIMGTLQGELAQSWINFKPEKGGGRGGKSLLWPCKASFWLW